MHLTTLALLQVLKFPNSTFLDNVAQFEYSPDEWQCTTLPSSFSKNALQKKCPSLMNELNVCCAVWNDCFEQKKGEAYCNKKYYGCNQIALSSASKQDFEQCSEFPAEVKDHLDYISPRPADFILPEPSLYMAESATVARLYESCPTKGRTFSACLHNLARDKRSIAEMPELKSSGKILNMFKLRVCMEMTLEDEDGELCKKNTENLLKFFDQTASYNNTIKDIHDRSHWKCGANQYDTYVTQVISGMGCLWLKEAFNHCCKHQSECYQQYQNKYQCDKAWDSCNSAVITNSDGSVVQECLPFTEWVDNFKTLNNVFAYSHESVVEESHLYFWIIVLGCTLSLLVVAYFFFSLICGQRKAPKYQQCEQKLTKTEPVPSV